MITLSLHVNKHCGAKVAHISRAKAEAEAQRLARVARERLVAYACKYCGKWHVGKSNAR
jgi:hypothetical protein